MAENMSVPLNDGRDMPRIGFGVWRIEDHDAERLVGAALDSGYRSIDTATVYGNEAGVGAGIRSWGGSREDVFVTTKVWSSDHGADSATRACEQSLERLGLDYVDLYLIHWPVARQQAFVETWRALISLREKGLVRSIGVSNFQPDHLQSVISATGVVPAVNQIELHPWLQQAPLRSFHRDLGVVTESWSPLGQGGDLLADPVVVMIAHEIERSPAQVVLRWHLQNNCVVIPKSATPSRIQENIDLWSFSLSERHMHLIAQLEQGMRLGPDPDIF